MSITIGLKPAIQNGCLNRYPNNQNKTKKNSTNFFPSFHPILILSISHSLFYTRLLNFSLFSRFLLLQVFWQRRCPRFVFDTCFIILNASKLSVDSASISFTDRNSFKALQGLFFSFFWSFIQPSFITSFSFLAFFLMKLKGTCL